jgi:hypothetical protein
MAVGLGGEEYADPLAFDAAYDRAMALCALLLVFGGLFAWATIRNPRG